MIGRPPGFSTRRTGPVRGIGVSGEVAVAVPTRDVAGQVPAAKEAAGHTRERAAAFGASARGSVTRAVSSAASPSRNRSVVCTAGGTARPPLSVTLPASDGANGSEAQPVGVIESVAVATLPGAK